MDFSTLKKNFNVSESEFSAEEIEEIKNQNEWLMKICTERLPELIDDDGSVSDDPEDPNAKYYRNNWRDDYKKN